MFNKKEKLVIREITKIGKASRKFSTLVFYSNYIEIIPSGTEHLLGQEPFLKVTERRGGKGMSKCRVKGT